MSTPILMATASLHLYGLASPELFGSSTIRGLEKKQWGPAMPNRKGWQERFPERKHGGSRPPLAFTTTLSVFRDSKKGMIDI